MKKLLLIIAIILLILITGCERKYCWICHTICTQWNYEDTIRTEIYCDMTASQIEAIKLAGYRPLPNEYRIECYKIK